VKDVRGSTYFRYEKGIEHIETWWENVKGIEHLGNLDVDGMQY
jgi:hypothetical protein